MLPSEAAAMPFPNEETTPPVTKMCFVAAYWCLRNAGKSNLRDDGAGLWFSRPDERRNPLEWSGWGLPTHGN
jgi:hypothetical protein